MQKIQKIIEYGLCLFLFFLPWQTRLILIPDEINGAYFEYGSISLYASDILLLLLLVAYSLVRIFDKNEHKLIGQKQRISIEKIFFLAFCAFALISFFSAENLLPAGLKLAWCLAGAGLFHLIHTCQNKERLIVSFFFGAFFQSLIGIWQFLQQKAFACRWLGMAGHNPSDLGASVVEAVGADGLGERWLRAYGGLDHPNIFGGYLAIAILLAIIFIIGKRKLLESAENEIAKIKYTILGGYVFLLSAQMALFFSLSRSAWLSLSFGTALFLITSIIKKDRFFQKELLKIMLFGGTLFFILFSSFNNLILVRMNAGSRIEKKSNHERIDSYRNGLSITKNNLLFGCGLGNFGQELAKLRPEQNTYYYQPPHNVFLVISAECGILALLTFIAWLVFLSIKTFKQKNFYMLGLIGSLTPPFLLDHYFASLHFGVLFLFIIFAFVNNNQISTEK